MPDDRAQPVLDYQTPDVASRTPLRITLCFWTANVFLIVVATLGAILLILALGLTLGLFTEPHVNRDMVLLTLADFVCGIVLLLGPILLSQRMWRKYRTIRLSDR